MRGEAAAGDALRWAAGTAKFKGTPIRAGESGRTRRRHTYTQCPDEMLSTLQDSAPGSRAVGHHETAWCTCAANTERIGLWTGPGTVLPYWKCMSGLPQLLRERELCWKHPKEKQAHGACHPHKVKAEVPGESCATWHPSEPNSL